MQHKEIKKFHHICGLLKRILPTLILVIGLDWMSPSIFKCSYITQVCSNQVGVTHCCRQP